MFPSRQILRALPLLAAALSFLPAAHAAPPRWMTEAMARACPAGDHDTPAAVIHDEALTTVASDGKITTRTMHAVRVLTRYGRDYATVAIPYTADTENISGFRAWLRLPSGEVKEYRAKDTADIALSPEAVYADTRSIVFTPPNVVAGSVFGFEYTREDLGTHGQDMWTFQSTIPVLFSRVTYKLAKGWGARSLTFNHADIQPVAEKDALAWELRDLPSVRTEPASPPFGQLAASIGIDLVPPAASSKRGPARTSFASWTDVSACYTPVHDTAAAPDQAIRQKVNALLAGAGPAQWERIRALARHAQIVRYVSIQMGLGRGGGYTPRAAAEVFKTNYGDCKDKTALLRAMLQAAGISSHPVLVYAADRHAVSDRWPTPAQFDHCIIGICVDETVSVPAVIEVPGLGRLLIFDPTNPSTALGNIDSDLQGGRALVLAGPSGAMITLPFTPAESNHLERAITAQLTATGAIGARIKEHTTGQMAAYERALFHAPGSKYEKIILDWINTTAPGAKIVTNKQQDDMNADIFDLMVDFAAPAYARAMRDKLLVFKPAIVSRRHYIPFDDPDRRHPIRLHPNSFAETADILIPDGFAVDELPPPVDVAADFGRYTATCTTEAGKVHYRRSLRVNAATIPAANYKLVRRFYEAVRNAEQSPVVLVRR
ncbi:DUF3857 domain-containing protein [Termitidicoccus mucosus]|uniref:DUF3857 domain-containing protein n=1 Tax=Termitidicoccus mucosus TaxID=1184151 RepID=A0A178IFB0_9BACT|nr:hypothetical protein AW736_20560 [Opitutaceae bacterium TSB47]